MIKVWFQWLFKWDNAA